MKSCQSAPLGVLFSRVLLIVKMDPFELEHPSGLALCDLKYKKISLNEIHSMK